MKKRKWHSVLFIGLVLLLVSSTVTCAKPTAPAECKVTSLDIVPPEAWVGEIVNINIQVKNSGGAEGIYHPVLTVNGATAEVKEVALAPGVSKTVTFSLVKDTPGTYQVEVGGLQGNLRVIKLPNEVKLDVPFEPNLGGTCFSSSFAMVMRYWGKNVTVGDVLKVVGYPPFRGYEHPELTDWMEKNYRLELKYLPYSKVEDVKVFLAKGYPVVVHQAFSLSENSGHNRVVIGYSDVRAVFTINDPSELGPNYEMSYAVFETLWKRITLYETGPENKAYLVVPLE